MAATLSAQAELTVQITQGVEGGIPIAVVPFGGNPGGENIGSIVAADLARSGRFKVLSESQMLEHPTTPEQVRFDSWKTMGQDNLAIGQVQQDGPDHYVAQFYLFDVVRGNQLVGFNLPFSAPETRKTAHRIADIIYKQLTGENGAFATRVAYVTVAPGEGPKDRRYLLQVADTDGFNPQNIIKSREPIMSPAWSPDGRQIAYVSFESKTPAIFVQTLASGERQKVSDMPGINGAPAWSPDGAELAMTLSKDGNPDIYVMNLASRSLRRITNHYAIDTEPAWSKDGSRIVFTSDRGGKPQLYMVSSAGGEPQRITYEGDYNARGVFSPDGKSLAMVHGVGGNYRIALMDLASKQVRILTPGRLDESPGFAPNGSMILYASHSGGAAQLSAVSIDGKVRQSLRIDGGEVREPAWSP
ncbi:MAG: Tol-Pal system beta propeller repeat protein TolB [Methylococcaceae bacterium]|nr:Tol-Pal system beta propeller repeat protein TolB [Methylococcaceae bacterium]